MLISIRLRFVPAVPIYGTGTAAASRAVASCYFLLPLLPVLLSRLLSRLLSLRQLPLLACLLSTYYARTAGTV